MTSCARNSFGLPGTDFARGQRVRVPETPPRKLEWLRSRRVARLPQTFGSLFRDQAGEHRQLLAVCLRRQRGPGTLEWLPQSQVGSTRLGTCLATAATPLAGL